MLATLGVDPAFGVACLNQVGTAFAQDPEVLQRMGNFQQTAQVGEHLCSARFSFRLLRVFCRAFHRI
jgi:hypothetical protein